MSRVTGQDGGAGAEVSPGSVTLRLKLPVGVSYCDQGSYCEYRGHISIRRVDGTSLNVGMGLGACPVPCDTCQRQACPGLSCNAQAIAVSDEELTWNGGFWELGTCGSPVNQCLRPRSAPPGRYIATMCATPGTIETADGGERTCAKTADQTCIEVAFDLPSSSPVEGMLPLPR